MKTSGSLLVAAAALFDGALAHYRFTSLISNGTITGQYQYVRQNTNDNSPITDVTSDDIRCNQGTLPYGTSTSVATVVAGTSIGFELDIPIYHPGPLAVYMSKVTSGFTVETYDGSGPWFKIAELGATITPTAITFLSNNLGSYSVTIPATTPPGAYLLRIEQIGLHVAETVGGAQFYISCAQIQVNGPGGGTPGPTFLLPGGYDPNDPGLVIDIYYPIPQSYTPPGPAVWSGGNGGGSGTTPVGSAPTTPVKTSTLSTVVKSTSVVTTAKPTSTSTGATQALYGQCGGIGWTGPTVCAAPATCKVTNTYYSQCLD